MIALFDNIKTKQIADLVGVDYKDVKDIQLGDKAKNFQLQVIILLHQVQKV